MNLSPLLNITNDESLYGIAAYHAQQATEKCLKVILVNYHGYDQTQRRYRTHDIAGLLALIEEQETPQKPIPIGIPESIKIMSADITEWEANSRYNDNMVVLKENISIVLDACKKMLADLCASGLV